MRVDRVEYQAPLKEMRFVMDELAGLRDIANLPGFNELDDGLVSAVLDEAAKLANEVISPINIVGDRSGVTLIANEVTQAEGFKNAYQQFIAGGWNAVSAATEYGGMGLPELMEACTGEMWSAASTSFALCPTLTQGAVNALKTHGSDALKERFLNKLVTGEWTGTMNLTEPQAGSDLAAVRTIAEPEGDYYRLTGNKIFITWGDHKMTDNIIHLVLARLPDAPEGVKGISLFVVPKYLIDEQGSLGEQNDVYPIAVEHKMGIHASPTCVMSYGQTRPVKGKNGAIGYLIGEPNKGLMYMFTMMNDARLKVGMQGVALADRAYQHAVTYAKERVQGLAAGDTEMGAIIRHSHVRRMLLTMRALTEAARAINYVAVASADFAAHSANEEQQAKAQRRIDLLTPIAKGWATEVAQVVTSLGVQIHGGMGFIEETGAAQFMRDARITSIYEGTTGIQANDLIGRKLIRDKGQAMFEMLDEIKAFIADNQSADGQIATMISSLQAALVKLEEVSNWVLENHQQDDRLAASSAFSYLMLSGTVMGAYLLTKSAVIAAQKQAEDPSFYQSKIVVANYYAMNLLPQADYYALTAMTSSRDHMDMNDEWF